MNNCTLLKSYELHIPSEVPKWAVKEHQNLISRRRSVLHSFDFVVNTIKYWRIKYRCSVKLRQNRGIGGNQESVQYDGSRHCL